MGIRFGGGSNTPAPEPEPEPKVTLYPLANYGGSGVGINPGAHEPSIPQHILMETRIRSVKVPSGLQVILYPEPKFQGTAKVCSTDTPDVGAGFDLRNASILIKDA